jgi:hypothetical protein
MKQKKGKSNKKNPKKQKTEKNEKGVKRELKSIFNEIEYYKHHNLCLQRLRRWRLEESEWIKLNNNS